MPQMVRGGADVGTDCVPQQLIGVVSELCRQQRFNGWPDAIDDRTQVARLVFSRLLNLLQGRQNCAALGMPQYHNQPCAEPRSGKFYAADLRRRDYVSGHPNDKEVAQALVENDLRWYARVGTSEYRGKWLLRSRQSVATRLARQVAAGHARVEAAVALSQAFECFCC